MFKGCFFKIFLLFILVIGISYFLITSYSNEIMAAVKKEVITWMTSKIDDQVAELDKKTAAELSKNISSYVDELSKQDFSVAVEKADDFVKYLENILSDKQVNKEEIENLKKRMNLNEK